MVSRLLLFFLLFFCFFFCACGPDSSSRKDGQGSHGPEYDPSAQQPVLGGRILLGTIGEPGNLIPPLASDGASHEIADHIYVAPLRYDKDIQLEPWAAEWYRVEDNGLTLKFKLRKGIRWFDGVELTADDVEFTYRLMIDPDTPTAYAEDYKMIDSFQVTGRYGFEVRYKEPFARALVTWAHSILPRHVLEGEDLLQTKFSREPVGAGAFRLKSWEPGRRLTLVANEDYFLGRPCLDQVVYRIIPDTATMFMELKAQGLDMMNLTPQQYLFQTMGPDWDQNYRKYEYLSFSYVYLGYNLRHPFFVSPAVRRALTMALDKEEIVKGVLLGMGRPAIGPYKPGTWVFNDSLRPYGYNPEKALEVLAQEGWTDSDGDGTLDRDGHPFSFTILTNQGNDLRIKTATIIQHRLKQIGIKVEIRTVEWATFIKEFVDKGRFDAVILGWNILQDPDLFDVWHSSRIGSGGLNFVGYANQELDGLLEEGRRTLDRDRRKAVYDRIQEILHQDQPYTFLYVPMSLPIVQARFQGIEPAPAGITYNFDRWWVPREFQRYRFTPQP